MLAMLYLAACGDPITTDTFPAERAIAYCEQLQECGTLDQMGMSAYDCQLSQEQAYPGCAEADYDQGAAGDCLDEIAGLACDQLEDPLETIAPSCADVCP